MGFEEIAVDDVYAVIDRLGESHAQFQIVTHNQVRHTHLAPKHAAALANVAQESCVEEVAEVTPLGESHELPADISASAFEQSVTPSQSALLESQLLDFINEISVDVRQFRNELDASRTGDTLAGTMDHPAQEVDRLRHQSLRRALSWQFDVVEPEEAAAVQRDAESPDEASIPETPSSTNMSIDSTLAAMASDSIEAAEPTQSGDPNVAGRYSQLFTRLQRQRRRVELVMNHERRSGADAHQS